MKLHDRVEGGWQLSGDVQHGTHRRLHLKGEARVGGQLGRHRRRGAVVDGRRVDLQGVGFDRVALSLQGRHKAGGSEQND